MNIHSYSVAHEAIEALTRRMADRMLGSAGSFHVALSGGETAKRLFPFWSGPFADRLDWDRIRFYWVDERCVPPDDPQSNFGTAERLLFSLLTVPASHVHRIRGEQPPETEAERYTHLIGQELAEQLLKGQYEVVITTHLNTSHYHNHLVWNSVSMVDGKKYHSNAKSYFTEVRQISDQLCRKYGLSVIQTNQGKAMHYAQWKAEAEGKPTWRTVIRMDIRDAIGVSFSWSQFVKEMEKRGYTWKLNRKYPALKTPDMERYVRLRSLGKGYGEAEIREKILRPKIQQVYGKTQVQFPKRKLTGLQKLYFSYLYRMGVLQQKPKRISYAVRSDIRKLDLRIRQMEFLQKEGINTREELAAYRKPLEEQVLSLMKERRTLYRKEPGGMRIQEINGELKELRKKIRLSQQIEIQSKEMEERLKQAKEQEQIQESSGKQRREEERKR